MTVVVEAQSYVRCRLAKVLQLRCTTVATLCWLLCASVTVIGIRDCSGEAQSQMQMKLCSCVV